MGIFIELTKDRKPVRLWTVVGERTVCQHLILLAPGYWLYGRLIPPNLIPSNHITNVLFGIDTERLRVIKVLSALSK